MEEMRSLTSSRSNPPISVGRKPLEFGISSSRERAVSREDSPNCNEDDDDADDADDADATFDSSQYPGEQEANSKYQPSKDGNQLMWIIEIASLLLATVAFVAIIITLTIHRNRPLPQWPHLISINTLIAIFTAILKASLLVPVVESQVKM